MGTLLEKIDEEWVRKYPLSGPYYTSYPSVGEWSKDFKSRDFSKALDTLCDDDPSAPLSLYLHYPFCPELCAYCCCYVVISNDQKRKNHFSDFMLKEIDMLREYFEKKSIVPNIKEIHLGGGSPNVMDKEEFKRLVAKLDTLVDTKSLKEFALEIDVRTVDEDKVRFFHDMGINRISFGVQDFNPKVQEAVNRVQPVELVEKLLTPEIRNLFQSVNFDIMWGLPYQTRETFRQTIEVLKRLSPDRITLLHYGHFPDLFKHQGTVDPSAIPGELEKTLMNIEATHTLEESGYEKIGLDHFSKRDDELVEWKKDKRLVRSFIGYPGENNNLIGLGPSGLSSFSNYYSQNIYNLSDYYKAIEDGVFPTFRGYELSSDLLIRREVINEVLNYSHLDFADIEDKFKIDFKAYFKHELKSLADLIEDGLMELTETSIEVTPLGTFHVRYIAMVFDVFLQEGKAHKPSSRKDGKLASV